MVRRKRLTERVVPPVAETAVVAGEPGAVQTAAQLHDEGGEAGDALGRSQALGAGVGEREGVVEHHAPVGTERDVDVLTGDDAEVSDGPRGKRERHAVAGAMDTSEVTPRARRRARGGSVGHPRSGRVVHPEGERSTPPRDVDTLSDQELAELWGDREPAAATEGANEVVDKERKEEYTPNMPRRNTAVLPQRAKKMTTHQRAVHANNVRWAAQRAMHYDALLNIRGRVITAESALAELARGLPDEQRQAAAVALANLVGGFHELWKFSGHDLPVALRDYAAGVIDELRRQAATREVSPG